jgi:ABC-type uncharacterized transport system ATPase subunit
MSLLQVKNVSKNFGSLAAVNNISMTVEPGDPHITIDEVRFGTKQTSRSRLRMSAFGGKADIRRTSLNVCF